MKYQIGVMGVHDFMEHSKKAETDFKSHTKWSGIRLGRLINRAEYMRMYHAKNELKIAANLFYVEKLFDFNDESMSMDTEKKEVALSNQFESMFNDEKYSDFTIVTSDDQKIHVHRNILSARSAVFDTMLQTTMKENEINAVLINDIDGKSLVEFLRFIYSGKIHSFDGITDDLLYAAHKYEIEDLKPLCVRQLCLSLNESNALDTLLTADLLSEENLKKVCFSYLKM